jgi:hypothetical protein
LPRTRDSAHLARVCREDIWGSRGCAFQRSHRLVSTMNPLVRDLYKRVLIVGRDYPGLPAPHAESTVTHACVRRHAPGLAWRCVPIVSIRAPCMCACFRRAPASPNTGTCIQLACCFRFIVNYIRFACTRRALRASANNAAHTTTNCDTHRCCVDICAVDVCLAPGGLEQVKRKAKEWFFQNRDLTDEVEIKRAVARGRSAAWSP